MENREMICINCPLGCSLSVSIDGDNVKVSGNTCPRGEKYAIAEVTHPTRTLTTTVRVANRSGSFVAVKTKNPISKEKLFDAMRIVNAATVTAPVHAGDVIIADMLGESDLIATADKE